MKDEKVVTSLNKILELESKLKSIFFPFHLPPIILTFPVFI